MIDVEEAKEKIMMGAERRSKVITEDDKRLTAYHEAGHAIVGLNVKIKNLKMHKATIIPRGMAGGMVMWLPEKDEDYQSKDQFEGMIAMAMGGRVAEEKIFGKDKITTGAGGGGSSDIGKVTQIAKDMVTKYGMSEELGPIAYGDNEEEVFLGRSITKNQSMSEETVQKIDKEVKRIIFDGYKKAQAIMTDKMDDLHKLAKALMDYETLTFDEISNILYNNTYPTRHSDKPDHSEDKGKKESALGSIGLKPKLT